ncbi:MULTISPECIES: GGDEF domain-containing protein [unclassified Halomonas]|uniref:GGDEF domain-containing protein n=1 Tax=unclassified Halomonas TaxID=2609666 RepID=UPI004034714F
MLPLGDGKYKAILWSITLCVWVLYSGVLQADSAPQPLHSWEYHWGDLPAGTQGTLSQPPDTSLTWNPINFPADPPERNGQEQVWFRGVLPDGNWNDPVLYITSINLIGQIYLDDALIYQYGEFDAQGRGDFAGWPWHMVELPEDFSGKPLNIRVFSYYTNIGLWGEVKVMERLEVLESIIHMSVQDLAVSALVFVLAFIATIFAVIGPERRGFSAIALFAYASGLMLLAEAPARQLIVDNALAWDTLRAGSYYTLPIALGLLLSHWFSGKTKRWLTSIWALHLAYLAIAISLVQLGFVSLSITFPVFDALLTVTLPTMLILALFRFRELSTEQRLLALCFTFFIPLLLTDMLVAHGFIAWRTIPLSYGTLIFSLANAAIFLWHYRHTQQQMSLANETLEYQVASRTKKLGRLVQELENLSFKDPLTNLYNRRHFDRVFEHECLRAQQNASQLSLLMLDIDHFKQINDHFGHDAGDSVLVEMAELLKHHFRGLDIVCRFGGEEFVALLPGTSVHAAESRANALLTLASELSLAYQGAPLTKVTLSCGVATYPDHTQDPFKLLKMADEMLYQAKNGGRNRCIVWPETPKTRDFMLGQS